MLPKVAALAVASVLAGGAVLILSTDTPGRENPTFAAWFINPPKAIYDAEPLGVTVAVVNVEPKKIFVTPTGVDNIGESGAHNVCLLLNGNATTCYALSLDHQEAKELVWNIGPLAVGNHSLAVRNASYTLQVLPTPRLGAWINGALVDIRVDPPRLVDASLNAWNWTYSARYHNGTVPVEIDLRLGTGTTALSGQSSGSVEGTLWRPLDGVLVRASVRVLVQETIVSGKIWEEADVRLFRWSS